MNLQFFPASFHQERLWFIDNFEKDVLYEGAPTYHNLSKVLKISGTLNEELLKRSLDVLVERHESLRTKISMQNGEIMQVVSSNCSIQIEKIEKQNLNDNELELFCFDRISRAFFIETQSLFRVELIELGVESFILIFVSHHIISDRKSMEIVLKDFISIYNSLFNSSNFDLPILEIQYADFANWQKNLSTDVIDKLMFFWREKLNLIKPLILHTDNPREHIHVYKTGTINEKLQISICEQIQKLKGKEYFIFYTAFEILMHKYSRQNQIAIGTIYNNRSLEGTENMVGPVSNLIVMNNKIFENDLFGDLVNSRELNFAQSLNHASLPFDKLVSELNPEKDMSRTALFDVIFHYEESASDFSSKLGNSQCEIVENNLGLGKYDFNLMITKVYLSYNIHFTYNELYYTSETAQRMLNHYLTLLSNIDRDDILVSELNYISEHEEKQIKLLFDNTNINWPKGKTIVSLFQEQVNKYEKNKAISFNNLEVSYKELNNISNQFSHFLSNKYNIQPREFVALLLPKSEKQIIAILAVLKCGAVYVPIDKDYPEERISYIINDSGAKICIDDNLFTEFMNNSSFYPDTNPIRSILPYDLAYLIYTSGSTGNPKGVMVEHRNVVRLFYTDSALFDFNYKDVWTMYHSYCFDFSVWEIFGALLFGGKLVIIPKNTGIDPSLFWEFIKSKKITVLSQTPSAFYNLLKIEPWIIKSELDLKYIVFGGESLHPGKLKDWYNIYSSVRLINMYGITETTVHVTYKEITQKEIFNNICNIGISIPTLSCFVLDDERRILPKLIPGELWVGGEGVSRGYLNQPELTNARFIPNPFGKGLLYSSGDIVRILSSNELEYIGRKDNQVKIRGYRIELSEIEKMIQNCEFINETVVLEQRKLNNGNELVAFYTSYKDLKASEIRMYLKQKLPDYMIPSFFVQMDEMPLTSNGKVDKSFLLKKMDLSSISSGLDYLAPTNEIEEKLVLIWKKILNKEQIGIRDNFFELGGHSLKAVHVLLEIHKVFDEKLDVSKMFMLPTVEMLAIEIKNSKWLKMNRNKSANVKRLSI